MTRLLDITRLIRRAGRPMTGIDRVEFAYLRTLSARDEPLFCVARTPLGYVLLDHAGARHMAGALRNDSFGALDPIGFVSRHRDETIRRAEAEMRRVSHLRVLPQRLGAALRHHLPDGTRYLNVGHANLTDRMITALKRANAQISVLLHDVIPLEAPEMQREKSVLAFRRFLHRVETHADLIICNSQDTWTRAQPFLRRKPDHVIAHLGIELAPEDLLPPELDLRPPYFVTVGTIEPRKNHQLLLDVWEKMGNSAPHLVIAGRRGWKNEAVFARLDARPARIIEAPNLSDGMITGLLKGAHGMVFPSYLEGFGLPPMEAAAFNVPVLCQPLPVLREVMGEVPIYLDGDDPAAWSAEIAKLMKKRHNPPIFVPPAWTDHFNIVLMLT